MDETPRSKQARVPSKSGQVSLAIVEDDQNLFGLLDWGNGFYDFERPVKMMNSPARLHDVSGEFSEGFFKIRQRPSLR